MSRGFFSRPLSSLASPAPLAGWRCQHGSWQRSSVVSQGRWFKGRVQSFEVAADRSEPGETLPRPRGSHDHHPGQRSLRGPDVVAGVVVPARCGARAELTWLRDCAGRPGASGCWSRCLTAGLGLTLRCPRSHQGADNVDSHQPPYRGRSHHTWLGQGILRQGGPQPATLLARAGGLCLPKPTGGTAGSAVFLMLPAHSLSRR